MYHTKKVDARIDIEEGKKKATTDDIKGSHIIHVETPSNRKYLYGFERRELTAQQQYVYSGENILTKHCFMRSYSSTQLYCVGPACLCSNLSRDNTGVNWVKCSFIPEILSLTFMGRFAAGNLLF
jgi:hypothetical protein